ncbi:MAG: site-2 protease family protein [Candidatus Bathyarchaeia archaeon]
MSETPSETSSTQQVEFEKLTQIVSAEFQVEEALLEHNVPKYYLKQPQETKQAFLRLLKNLEAMNLIAFLRKVDNRIVLRIVPKPPVKKSNILVNWILFFATIGTTFVTGYLLSLDLVNPFIGGATFTVAMMAVLGMHEMGHKISANEKGVEATPPYFIPGPPPFGTFGAVIMQRSLPPNKDALFDIGASGPIMSFIVATIVSAVGLTMLIPSSPRADTTVIQIPIIWILLAQLLSSLNMIPRPIGDQVLYLHPVTFAGWVGLVVTLLNILPAAMLDGGHVARSMVGERPRLVLSVLSILFLFYEGFWPMAFLVLFLSMYKHPGPLDDVSSLSRSRKFLAIALVAIFVLCLFTSF